MPIILDNISYTYMPGTAFEHAAVKNVSLKIEEREFVAIIGHTGSGKSTLISHMNGLIQPTSGKVTVDGIDMSDKKQRKAGRALVGMVFQYPEYQLFEETVRRDIEFGVRNMGLDENEIDIRVRDSMRLVGLDYDEFAEKSPFELSGGEKRRVALAGIIVMRPKYLVLDEPMAGLDPQGRRAVIATIKQLRAELGCAIIMISHSMDDVAENAERVAVLENGKVLLDGTTAEVFSHSEMLLAARLGLPQAQQIARLIRENGVSDFPTDIYRMDTLYDEIMRRLAL